MGTRGGGGRAGSGVANMATLAADPMSARCRRPPSRFAIINGLLLPGGGATLAPGHRFYDTAQQLVELALAANDKGDYFPVGGEGLRSGPTRKRTWLVPGGKEVYSSGAMRIGRHHTILSGEEHMG